MRALLIAEKPSLMREIRDAYNSHKKEIGIDIDFLAQAGHLVGLKLPSEIDANKYGKWKLDNFPIDVPYQYHILSGKNDLVKQIKEAIHSGNYDFVIHAGDPDGEGELLVRLVLAYVKNTLPVKRFWSNDITHVSIINALKSLKDDAEYDNIYYAALIRQHADYQFGMNITGISSLKLGELYKLGRVKAAIIRMIVDRERAIRNFVPKTTYKRAFDYQTCEFLNDDEYETKELATKGIPPFDYAVITNVKDEIKSHKAPKLYKLSTLQSDAHKKLGFSGATTLSVLQQLYEGKYVTYPRTGCEYISTNVDIESILSSVSSKLNIDKSLFVRSSNDIRNDKTYCNDKAISTEGHTAIIPTGLGNVNALNDNQRRLYELIVRQFAAIFSAPKKVRNLTVTAIAGGNEKYGNFVYKETSDVEVGYEIILNSNYVTKIGKNIVFSKGMTITPITFHIKECTTKPPVRYNDGSLIKAMDNPEEFKDDDDKKVKYKIGTDATRSTIIEDCQKCGYFTKEKGNFVATAKAEKVIDEIGDIPLFNIPNSGRWEMMLEAVRHGEANPDEVEQTLFKECQDITYDIKNRNIQKAAFSGASSGKGSSSNILGVCPNCGANIITGKFGAYCEKKCGMTVSKAMGKSLTDTQIKSLLQNKRILVKGLTSKSGKTYDAYLTPAGLESFSYQSANGPVSGKSFKFEITFPPKK